MIEDDKMNTNKDIKNPYDFSYEEYIAFHNRVIKEAYQGQDYRISETNTFKNDDEVMTFYGAVFLDDYIEKLLS